MDRSISSGDVFQTESVGFPSAQQALEQAERRKRTLYPRVCQRALSTCLACISRAIRSGMTSTVADIPTFAFGEPLSSIDDVVDHVRTVLESRGYEVASFPGSSAIAITWTVWSNRDGRKPPTVQPNDNGATDAADAALHTHSGPLAGQCKYDVGL